MKIKITGDSVLDLPKALLEQHNISVIPFPILFGDDVYYDSVNITNQDIYEKVNNGADIPKTSALNISEYIDFFGQFANDYDAVIHFNITSASSSTHQNARLAAEEFTNVYPIDSHNISSGVGMLALKTLELSKTVDSIDELLAMVNDLIPKVKTTFMIDTLDYVRKGGRISSLTKLGADVFKLHPSVDIVDGVMKVQKMYRGSSEKSFEKFTKNFVTNIEKYDPKLAIIVTTGASDETLNMINGIIDDANYFEEILFTQAGCAVAAHAGPNTNGIVTVEK